MKKPHELEQVFQLINKQTDPILDEFLNACLDPYADADTITELTVEEIREILIALTSMMDILEGD